MKKTLALILAGALCVACTEDPANGQAGYNEVSQSDVERLRREMMLTLGTN